MQWVIQAGQYQSYHQVSPQISTSGHLLHLQSMTCQTRLSLPHNEDLIFRFLILFQVFSYLSHLNPINHICLKRPTKEYCEVVHFNLFILWMTNASWVLGTFYLSKYWMLYHFPRIGWEILGSDYQYFISVLFVSISFLEWIHMMLFSPWFLEIL